MRFRNMIVASALLSLVAWAAFTWPLAGGAVGTSIPWSSQNPHSGASVTMKAGDHLQLMYYFQLFDDMLRGNTPWFHNLYEFNEGDDEARFRPFHYYLPFSLIFSSLKSFLDDAAAWNLTGLVSIWLFYLFTVLLVREIFPEAGWRALLYALPALLLPYRWNNLMGGSPAGFAICWPPLVLLGLKKALVNHSWKGGLVAGVGITFCFFGDGHVFFFLSVLLPFFCLLMLFREGRFSLLCPRSWIAPATAMIPTIFFLVLTGLYGRFKMSYVAESLVQPRSIHEVALRSPKPWAILSIDSLGHEQAAFLGWSLSIFTVLGLAALATGAWRRLSRANLALTGGLAVILVVMITSALGPYGPHGGFTWRMGREYLPGYDLMRQTGKVMALAPSLIALAICLLHSCMLYRVGHRGATVLIGVLCAGMAFECLAKVKPGLSKLDPDQKAYAAVVDSAYAHGETARAVALPLWPGDAADSSVYQYYGMHNRIRMLNGYSPVTATNYISTAFRRFQPLNQGVLTDALLDQLSTQGIRHILLHESAWPEKVSPFPQEITVKSLVQHPRLRLLARDGAISAFRIEDQPLPNPKPALVHPWFPARRYEAEQFGRLRNMIKPDPLASGGAFAVLDAATNNLIRLNPTWIASRNDLAWHIRIRGKGSLTAGFRTGNLTNAVPFQIDSAGWTWLQAAHPSFAGLLPIGLRLSADSGVLEVDTAYLAAGPPWVPPAPGTALSIRPSAFFRSGVSDWDTGSVTMRAEFDRYLGTVLRGPFLPLDPGLYEIETRFESNLPEGSEVARLLLRPQGADPITVVLSAGKPAVGTWVQPENTPFELELLFTGASDFTVTSFALRRTGN